MAFALRCPDCRGKFKWEPLKAYPRHCPLCDADLGEEKDDNVVCLPAFLSAKSKANDAVYRQIEDSSEVRVQKAAEAAGCSPSEMSGLKITNLNDTRHEGAIAAQPVVNAVTQQMDMMSARGMPVGFQAAPNAAEYGGMVKTGPHPNAGAKTLGAIQRRNGHG